MQVSLASQAHAVAESWQVGRVAGHAWIDRIDGERTDLVLGMEVQPGVTIYTADRATVTLLRGPETMIVGPTSIVAISEHPTQGLTTTVLERAGSVEFDVDRQNVRHFSVETPMLAAVVKGTRFKVSVNRRDGGVSVSRGTVEVTSLRSGQATDVTVGQHARIASGGNMSVGGLGRPAPIVQGAPRAPIVAPAGVAATTGALTTGPVATDFTAAELAAVATVATPQVTVGEVTVPAVATTVVSSPTPAAVHNSVVTPSTTVASPSPLAVLTATIAKAFAPGGLSAQDTHPDKATPSTPPVPTNGTKPGQMPGPGGATAQGHGWGFGWGPGWSSGPNGVGPGLAHAPAITGLLGHNGSVGPQTQTGAPQPGHGPAAVANGGPGSGKTGPVAPGSVGPGNAGPGNSGPGKSGPGSGMGGLGGGIGHFGTTNNVAGNGHPGLGGGLRGHGS